MPAQPAVGRWGPEQIRQPAPGAPPWVIQQKAEKSDVAHLMKDDHPDHKQPQHHHAHQQKPEPKPLTPDEQKKMESHKRLLSKLEYYISEYGLWIILVLVVVLVFLVATYVMISKGGAPPA